MQSDLVKVRSDSFSSMGNIVERAAALLRQLADSIVEIQNFEEHLK